MDEEQTGGSDIGRDHAREWGDAPAPTYRDAPPEHPFVPIDPDAPVSGHPTEFPDSPVASLSPENDWSAAEGLIFPLLRPAGAAGLHVMDVDQDVLQATASQSHAQPIVDDGPCGLSVVYAIAASGFDVIVNGDHLLSWGIGPESIQDAAIANLAAWSASTPWTTESSGERNLLSSDSGQGWDASRVLLPEVRAHIGAALGGAGRILVGLPERHLLVAATMRQGDEDFGALFAEFVVEQSGGADEPIDRRLFELVDGQLVDFAP